MTALKKGNDLVQFVYDANGRPVFMRVNGTTEYAYLYNGQGDVTGLVDSGNNEVVSYQYDSWGNVTDIVDYSGCSLSNLNPIGYRAYVYDQETGLYYLGKRYYDAGAGRFIGPDAVAVINSKKRTLYELNLYAYCDNNPVKRKDLGGFFWETVWDVLSLGESIAVVLADPWDPMNWGFCTYESTL